MSPHLSITAPICFNVSHFALAQPFSCAIVSVDKNNKQNQQNNLVFKKQDCGHAFKTIQSYVNWMFAIYSCCGLKNYCRYSSEMDRNWSRSPTL